MKFKNKKNFYKNICLILIALVSITVGIVFLLNNVQGGTPELIVEEAEGVVGSTVEVPVLIENNPGTYGGQIFVDFDSNYFSFVSADMGTVYETLSFNLYEDDKTSTDSVVLLTEHKIEYKDNKNTLVNSTEDGTVVILKFMIKAGAPKGDHAIKINQETNFCDADGKMIDSISYVDGIITVE